MRIVCEGRLSVDTSELREQGCLGGLDAVSTHDIPRDEQLVWFLKLPHQPATPMANWFTRAELDQLPKAGLKIAAEAHVDGLGPGYPVFL